MSFLLTALARRIKFCECGVLRPDEETRNRIKASFQALIAPYYLARVNRSRGKKHGDQPWQEDYWKAVDATRGAQKHKHSSILSRWENDEQYRTSQLKNGWKETYWRYVDYLTTVDISHNAPYHHRNKYESTITMKRSDSNLQAGPPAEQCRLGFFQDSDFSRDLKDSSRHQEKFSAFSEV